MKWLVLFPDNWLAFSPSTINFYHMLKEHGHECLVVHFNNGEFDSSRLQIDNYEIKIPARIWRVISQIKLLIKAVKIIMMVIEARRIRKNFPYERIVGIDDVGFLSACFLDKNAIYYSLEISRDCIDRFIAKYITPRLLIIQTKERAAFLNKKCSNVAYIQNSPILTDKIFHEKKYSGKLCYLGNVTKRQGVEFCISALYGTNETTLVLKGLSDFDKTYLEHLKQKHDAMIQAGRLMFDFSYIEDINIKPYLEAFDIGFCFFDPEAIKKYGYNFESSPSGKIFNYFKAGVPVIANNIVGYQPVREYEAGILLDSLDVSSLSAAIEKIKANYAFYSKNAFNASQAFDYKKMFNDESDKIFMVENK